MGPGLRGAADAMRACAAAGGWLQQEADALAPEDIEFVVVSEKQVRPDACMHGAHSRVCIACRPKSCCWTCFRCRLLASVPARHALAGLRLCPAVPGSASSVELPVLLALS